MRTQLPQHFQSILWSIATITKGSPFATYMSFIQQKPQRVATAAEARERSQAQGNQQNESKSTNPNKFQQPQPDQLVSSLSSRDQVKKYIQNVWTIAKPIPIVQCIIKRA